MVRTKTKRKMPSGRFKRNMVDLRVQVLKRNLYTSNIKKYPFMLKRFFEQQEKKKQQHQSDSVIDRARRKILYNRLTQAQVRGEIDEGIDVAAQIPSDSVITSKFRALISSFVRKFQRLFGINWRSKKFLFYFSSKSSEIFWKISKYSSPFS